MLLLPHHTRSAYATATRLIPLTWTRSISASVLAGLARPVQSYISASRDPYLNLSIEHYLLQRTAQESSVLFVYVNRPSIVIGRNQNPWLEVNLALLDPPTTGPDEQTLTLGAVDLVRRRSGGGTVFHDLGNVNWTVICPSADFTRDKHAEMVVRALRSCGIDRARVNARHDIVLDQGEHQGEHGARADPNDTHSTPYEATDFATPKPLKVSGSAYKLIRNRALHHGTCLLASPNLNIIPEYLHSPAKPFITARGVESVSSPVGNIMLENEDFIASVQRHFAKQYPGSKDTPHIVVGDEWLEDKGVNKGYDELKSLDWTYLQTPQFTVSIDPKSVEDINLELSVRYGAISSASLTINNANGLGEAVTQLESLEGLRLHQVKAWEDSLGPGSERMSTKQKYQLLNWLNKMFPGLKQ